MDQATGEGRFVTSVPADGPIHADLTAAIHSGDLAALDRLLLEHPEIATARFGDAEQSRSSLHIATDWPGHFPNVAATIGRLVAAGADVDARFVGAHAEAPLHWAASSDDVEALDALLDAGADIEADGGVLTGGPPLDDAIIFRQWNAARRLVERGATTRLFHAAALGDTSRVRELLDTPHPIAAEHVTGALYHAAGAGHHDAAAALLDAGADPLWLGWEGLRPLDLAVQSGDPALAALLRAAAGLVPPTD